MAEPFLLPYRQLLENHLHRQALPVDKFGHQPRLYALTQEVGRGMRYNDEVVFAAAYLHDLGVFVGHRPEQPEALAGWDHVAYAVEQAPAILKEVGFPQELIPPVLRAIETHQPRDTPASMEAAILRDADILEQLGAVGILRAVAKVGRDTRFATFTPAIAFLERNLQNLPKAIQFSTTKALAEPRIALLRVFLDGVRTEAGEHLH